MNAEWRTAPFSLAALKNSLKDKQETSVNLRVSMCLLDPFAMELVVLRLSPIQEPHPTPAKDNNGEVELIHCPTRQGGCCAAQSDLSSCIIM